MNREIFCTELPTEHLFPTKEEIAARLRVPIGYRDEKADAIERELLQTVRAKMAATRVFLREAEDGKLDFEGLFSTGSAALKKNLSLCRSAYLFAVTLGMETERYLHRLSILSPAKHFIADALASAYAEAAADLGNQMLAKRAELTPRFSPGYADLPLSLQPALLSALEANKYLHITIKDSFLMVPQKSITAIIGIRD